MKFIAYDVILHIALIVLFPYFVLRTFTRKNYTAGMLERFGLIESRKLKALAAGPVVWVHAVSVGEAKAVLPLVRLLKERRPGVKVVFSTVTPTGREVAGKEGEGVIDALIYFPLDISWITKRVARLLEPALFIVVEKEVWPNMLKVLEDRGVPVVVVNGTLSERSFRRYRLLGFFFRDIFSKISFYCARTEEDARKARELWMDGGKVQTLGNLKFDMDSAPSDASSIERIRDAMGLKPSDTVFVAGSTHAGEEKILLDVYGRLKRDFTDLRMILAPRHPERFDEVASLIEGSGLSYFRRSKGGSGDIILLDTLGELRLVYGLSTIAFVGGTLVDIGGHNLLEPAFFARPVLYGPHVSSCREMAVMLEDSGASIRVRDGEALYGAAKRLLEDRRLAEEMGRRARDVVDSNRGATKKTLEVIERFLDR